MSLVRARCVFAYGEGGIQQQYPLRCPLLQVATPGCREPNVIAQLLEDIDERLRERDAVLHRKAEPMGLTVPVVWILPDNHNFYLVNRRAVEGVEDAIPRRKYPVLLLFFNQKLLQRRKIGRLKLIP